MAQTTRSRAPHGGEIIEASRRGAHRARPSAVLAVLPALAVIAILAALGVLVYTMLLKPLTSATGGVETVGGATSASATAGAAGTAKASASAGAGATGAGSASASAGASASVDPNVVANFYNATTVKGLSRKAAAQAQAAGWRVGAIQTWSGPAVTGTTIYVATSQLQASGEAMAKALGAGVVKVSASKAGKGTMSVVVGSDYTG